MCKQLFIVTPQEGYKKGEQIYLGRVGLFDSIERLKNVVPIKKLTSNKYLIVEINVDDCYIQKRKSNNYLRINSGAVITNISELN